MFVKKIFPLSIHGNKKKNREIAQLNVYSEQIMSKNDLCTTQQYIIKLIFKRDILSVKLNVIFLIIIVFKCLKLFCSRIGHIINFKVLE